MLLRKMAANWWKLQCEQHLIAQYIYFPFFVPLGGSSVEGQEFLVMTFFLIGASFV